MIIGGQKLSHEGRKKETFLPLRCYLVQFNSVFKSKFGNFLSFDIKKKIKLKQKLLTRSAALAHRLYRWPTDLGCGLGRLLGNS